MKKPKSVYTYRTDDVCVWVSMYRVFLQVTKGKMRELNMAHGDDNYGRFQEAMGLMGVDAVWMGDMGAMLRLGDMEVRMTASEVINFLRASQIKITLGNDVSRRMQAMLRLQQMWAAGYRENVKEYLVDTVFLRWNAPVLARQLYTVYASGVEPFSLLQWKIVVMGTGKTVVSLLWCGYWVPAWIRGGRRPRRKEGVYLWDTKKNRLPASVVQVIYNRISKYFDDEA